METYKDHYLAVYSVKWNEFHPKTFLSCSADWTIKMWIMDLKRPILSYDLGNAITDVTWSPYSSTVFASALNAVQNKCNKNASPAMSLKIIILHQKCGNCGDSKVLGQETSSPHPEFTEPLMPNHLLIGQATTKTVKDSAPLEQ